MARKEEISMEKDNGMTTVMLKRTTVEILEQMKVHPKQPLFEVVEELIKRKK